MSMKFFRGVVKFCIAVFVLWHMSAVLIYTIYDVEGVPVLGWLASKRDIVKPYMLMTSQWQRWNLFSPDPLRRVITLEIDQEEKNLWILAASVNERTVTLWQRAPELKLIRRLDADNMQPLQEVYVHDVCRIQSIPTGTRMRLRERWMVIPKNERPQSQDWWNAWQPEWYEDILLLTACPPPDEAS